MKLWMSEKFWLFVLEKDCSQENELGIMLGNWWILWFVVSVFVLNQGMYLLLAVFDYRAVSSTSIYGLNAKHGCCELKWKKQGAVPYSTDWENEVSKMFISLGNWIKLESTTQNQSQGMYSTWGINYKKFV